jgi:FKBP-type peptidyl-prolyl cis-trans isomerase 2
MAIEKGDKVKVEYKGTLDDGTVFDNSEKHGPIEFEAGAGRVIKGFDEAVMGMEEGEEKNIQIVPEDAYGNTNPDLVKKIPRNELPQEMDPKPGMVLVLKSQDGNQIPARVTEISDSHLSVDFNHPLAGKTLNFSIKVVGVS